MDYGDALYLNYINIMRNVIVAMTYFIGYSTPNVYTNMVLSIVNWQE